MRTLGQLLMCVLLAGPSTQAAFGPWDFELDGTDAKSAAAVMANAIHHQVTAQSNQLALYVELPSAQLRAVAELPLVRELARSLRLWEVGRRLAFNRPAATPRACPRPH